MKCRLCGQPMASHDKMCGDCSRALRRAREGSAALRKSPEPVDRRKLPRPRIELVSTPDAPARLVSRPRWPRALAFCAIGVAAIGGTYYTMSAPDRPAASPPATLETAVAPTPDDTADADGTAAAANAPEIVPAGALGLTSTTAASAPLAPATSLRESPAPAAVRGASRAKAGTKTSPSEGANSTSFMNDGAAKPATGGAEPEPAPQVARAVVAAPSAREAAPSLANALERCSQEKFLSGVICEQKVRLQYCEGKWGQVPECTSKPRVD